MISKLVTEDSTVGFQILSTNMVNTRMEAKIQELKENIEKKKRELEAGTALKKDLESQLEECFVQLEGSQ